MQEVVNFIIQMINSVGFPIACCGVMMWYINKQSERHKEEVAALKISLDKNTEVLEKILLKGDTQ